MMNIKLLCVVVVLVLTRAQLCFSSAGPETAGPASQKNLTIRLPREVTVTTETLTLGQIAMITGDEELAANAGEIELGQISVPGQKLTIDRALIRSRLACSPEKIGDCKPALLGADRVIVRQLVKVIKGDSFVKSAIPFLNKNISERTIADWEPLREPAELILANQPRDIELRPGLVSRGATGRATVEVSVFADGIMSGSRQIVLRPKYNVHRAVTVTQVKAGEMLTKDNTRIENALSYEPQASDWAPPYGLVAVRDIAAGAAVEAGLVKAPKAQVIIERNQTVVIRIDKPGLVVTAMGKAMQQGKLDDYIKVRNTDSQRIIMARVNEDGTVEPVF